MLDLIIKKAVIIDGSGRPAIEGDIGVKKGKIDRIGRNLGERAMNVINAEGLVASPGFIDVHNNSDLYWTIFEDPRLPSATHQGITTIIGGNDGSSLAPLVSSRDITSLQKWADINDVQVNWLRMSELLDYFDEKGLGVNFGTLVGHSTIRRGIVGDENRAIKPDEEQMILRAVEDALQEGALGVSTGLKYSHELGVTTDELINLAKVVAANGGVYASHMRNEGSQLIESIQEMLTIAMATGVSLQISHLKAKGQEYWNKLDEALAMINEAVNLGAKVHFDFYPYRKTFSVLYAYLPKWATQNGRKAFLTLIQDEDKRRRLIDDMQSDKHDYGSLTIAINESQPSLVGKTLVDIAAVAEAPKLSVEEIIIDTLEASWNTIIFDETIDPDSFEKLLLHPQSMVATDAPSTSIPADIVQLYHPRSFGTFPKILQQFARDEKIISFEETIMKMTSIPARKFGLADRGYLAPGYAADMVLWHPALIADNATYINPYRYPSGIEHVFINGHAAVGVYADESKLPGQVIRH
ncbi:amidohydrolase family protein [Patescibacteria group bacterium]